MWVNEVWKHHTLTAVSVEERSAMCCIIILEVMASRVIRLLASCKNWKKNKKTTAETMTHAHE